MCCDLCARVRLTKANRRIEFCRDVACQCHKKDVLDWFTKHQNITK